MDNCTNKLRDGGNAVTALILLTQGDHLALSDWGFLLSLTSARKEKERPPLMCQEPSPRTTTASKSRTPSKSICFVLTSALKGGPRKEKKSKPFKLQTGFVGVYVVFNHKKPQGELLTSRLLNGITDVAFQAVTLKTDPNFDQALRFSLKACILPTQKKNEVKEASFEKINRAIKHSFRLASQGINH